MKQFNLALMLMVLLFSVKTDAQNNSNWCGTDQHLQEQHNNNPALLLQHEQIEQYILDHKDDIRNNPTNKKAITFVIPVVWHVITNNGQGNVTKADIDDQMLTLNEDFQRLNGDASNTRAIFAPYAADIQVEFRLAHIDPNGNCTEGITRTESPLALGADDNIKGVSYWDSKKYFNIWTVITMAGDNPPSIILGYAQFPTSGINNTYGVVMRYNYISRTDRTLSHEVGHCFGLYHTFQSGCGGSCSSTGDRCCDTPPVDVSTQGCDVNQNSCNNDGSGPDPWGGNNMVDQIENFMSYDACQNMFSLDQKARMYTFLNSTSTTTGLNQLTTPANLAATGTANPYNPVICTPVADFSYNKDFICEGESISFSDDSYNATPTTWNWTFTGGTPASSTASNPTITYNTAGTYTVTHQPSTTAGSDTKTKTNIITVSSLTADYTGPIVDGFENAAQFNADWFISDGSDAYKWKNTTTAAATGSRSVMIENYNLNSATDIDFMITPSYDLSAASSKIVKFKIAYANKIAGNTDRLMCYYSINCGQSWLLKMPITNNSLKTAPDHTNTFIPTSSEWVEKTMDFSSLGSTTNIRFKFQFESGGGNNIYIDDINIAGSVGVDDFSNIANFNIYPNPTNSSAQISFNLIKNVKNLSIKVKNALGQEVTNIINNQAFSTGKYTLKIDEQRQLSSGIYFVEFNADNNIKIQKLIIQ